MIVQREIDEQQVVDIVNNLIPDLSGDISDLQADVLALEISQLSQDTSINQNTANITTLQNEQIIQDN